MESACGLAETPSPPPGNQQGDGAVEHAERLEAPGAPALRLDGRERGGFGQAGGLHGRRGGEGVPEFGTRVRGKGIGPDRPGGVLGEPPRRPAGEPSVAQREQGDARGAAGRRVEQEGEDLFLGLHPAQVVRELCQGLRFQVACPDRLLEHPVQRGRHRGEFDTPQRLYLLFEPPDPRGEGTADLLQLVIERFELRRKGFIGLFPKPIGTFSCGGHGSLLITQMCVKTIESPRGCQPGSRTAGEKGRAAGVESSIPRRPLKGGVVLGLRVSFQ